MRTVLGALLSLLVASAAEAQVVIVDGTVAAPPCAPACPACLPGVACPPCSPPPECGEASAEIVLEVAPPPAPPIDAVVVSPAPPGTVTLYAPDVGAGTSGRAPSERAPRAPVTPAPGTLGVGYFGGWDGIDVWSGGGLRFTGHLVDIAFIEVSLGVAARSWDAMRSLIELPLLVGARLMGPLVTPIARMYATLATGIALRTVTNQRDAPVWGAWPVELGGGLELGGPLDDRFAIGAFVDVRATARVPFEREAATIGIGWSAGLALLWF